MPSTNDLKKKNNKPSKKIIPESKTGDVRRPGLESKTAASPAGDFSSDVDSDDVIEVRYGVAASTPSPHGHSVDPKDEAPQVQEPVKTTENNLKPEFKLNFIGSDLIRKVFPKSLDVVEKVAEDWKKDGEFDEIPIPQPLVQFVVGESLRRVKRLEKGIEKKIEEVLPEVLIRAQSGIEKVQSGIKTAKKLIKK
jgi:hypothetical protein